MFFQFLYLVQQHKILYVLFVGIVLGITNWVVYFVQKNVDKYKESTHSIFAKRTHLIITSIICFLAAIIPLIISIYYPFTDTVSNYNDKKQETTKTSTKPNYSNYLKLSFYNGKFSYRTYTNQIFYNENDVITESDKAYFSDPITPLVYITIIDNLNQVIYEDKSEHLNSCLIPIDYGTYTLFASCENYRKYTITITLTPDNKKTNYWQHNIFFIPDEYIATDLKIQVLDKNGVPLNNCEVSIGYTGFTLTETIDETGIINELFTLTKGEYIVYIDNLNLTGRFYVNELTNNESLILVKLE